MPIYSSPLGNSMFSRFSQPQNSESFIVRNVAGSLTRPIPLLENTPYHRQSSGHSSVLSTSRPSFRTAVRRDCISQNKPCLTILTVPGKATVLTPSEQPKIFPRCWQNSTPAIVILVSDVFRSTSHVCLMQLLGTLFVWPKSLTPAVLRGTSMGVPSRYEYSAY